jgi:glycosyltransferase involved in cell wall biosynthesis
MKPAAASRRTVRGVSPGKLRATLIPEAVGAGLRALSIETERRYRIEDWFLGLDARRHGLAGANVVLNTSGNGGIGFLRWAKAQGTRIATDIVITPSARIIEAEERARWPDWMPAGDMSRRIAIYRRHIEELVAVSDVLLCPSETVIDGLATVPGFDPRKVRRVPYSLGATRIKSGEPVAKRILFCGEASLRKGLPYLAEAARQLRAADTAFEIRVAGHVSDAVRARPECAALRFLGHLGPEGMEAEFRTADLFCLPSLAEGMASATIEALAHGLPSVVTRAAGSPVRHGVEGLVVPERDSAALSAALMTIALDRPLRDRMSAAALRRAGEHRPEAVGEILHAALLSAVSRP